MRSKPSTVAQTRLEPPGGSTCHSSACPFLRRQLEALPTTLLLPLPIQPGQTYIRFAPRPCRWRDREGHQSIYAGNLPAGRRAVKYLAAGG